MRIVIATGIYPPEIGGPAEYAKNLADAWKKDGHKVSVKIFGKFQKYPWGLRHVIFFFYILPSIISADYIVALDAFSAGVVTVASKLFSKKIVFRTGGDVLWELYTERTGEMVLLRDFYQTSLSKLSLKEKTVFRLMKWTLQNLSAIIWSTQWQKSIFMKPYELYRQKHFVVENYYGPKIQSVLPENKNFVASTRPSKWKNIELLKKAFDSQIVSSSGAKLDMQVVPHDKFLDKISCSYAVIIVSLGDISPNTILDAIRCQKPFILTQETGIYDRIKDIGIFVDPKSPEDIREKILWLCDPINYEEQKRKVESFSFLHTWEDIAREYMDVYNKIK